MIRSPLLPWSRLHVICAALLTLPASFACAIPLSAVLPGQLLINEIMVNPAGDDTLQEWFEVRNVLPVPVDLTGMAIVSNNGSFVVSGPGTAVGAGAFFLFARSGDSTVNGGLPTVDYAWGQTLTLTNTGGQLALKQNDGSLITSVSWGNAESGAALQLFKGMAPLFGPDDLLKSTSQYSPDLFPPPPSSLSNFGTPGASASPPPAVAGTSSLLITEIMANPSGADADQEWFEVQNTSGAPFNLDGVTITSCSGSFTVSGGNHVIPSGAFFVFARTDDPTVNGGLPRVDYAWGQALNLVNANCQLSISDSSSALIVRASWTDTVNSRSLELAGGTAPQFGPADFVQGTNLYTPPGSPPPGPSFGNLGTPRSENDEPQLITGIPPFDAAQTPAPSSFYLLAAALAALFFWVARTPLRISSMRDARQ